MAGPRVQAVDAFAQLLEEMLQTAEGAKSKNRIEAPLNKSDLGEPYERVDSIFGLDAKPDLKKRSQWAVIETATRDAFNGLLASTTIDSPFFVKLWNLLDTISILSDDEQCDPALLFWLVEELLDSQTIAGCRKIFDYLESRRERITAKHFGQKNLVILRSCNELLRRLSRAEDTAFCGRVFMFMFQSFPLGERSTVNLRGEYHTENITTFDSLPPKDPPKESDPEKMDVDTEATAKTTPAAKSTSSAQDQISSTKGVTFSKTESPMSPDELYPIFWSLQQYLNQPKKLFDQANFTDFKSGLEATMVMFKSVQSDNSGRSDESKRGIKRKRGQGDDDLANAFNPKYLTSRDLFELEISDLSFRRNILVQVLIVVDFLLSMSAKAKEKLAKASLPAQPNKSVMYADQLLSEEDAKWASEMKRSIADYLKQGLEGPFFYRMVETVLSRDKNWVRWKIENCPSITKPAVTPEDYLAAKAAAKKATTNKRLRPNPLGSLDLKFLSESQNRNGLERLKDPSRYRIPLVKSFQSKIELDDMDIEMARDEDAKNAAIESKASKSWRALRIASGSKLVAFDKIERSDKIDIIFQDNVKVDEPIINGDDEVMDSTEVVVPTDRRPIAITGTGKGALIDKLLEKHPKVLSKNVSHTTRLPRKGEVHGQHYYFVAKDEFNVLRDGDEFLEYECVDNDNYGTSRKVVEGILASGKLPIMNISNEGAQQIKENGYPVRYIFLSSADASTVENSRVGELYDKVIVNDDLEATFAKLERYIFAGEIADEARIAQVDGAAEIPVEDSQSKIKATLEKATAIESAMEVDETVEAGTPAVANDDTATATK